MMKSSLGIGVRAGTVEEFNLLKACTIRHPPVAFRTQKVGELCEEVDSLTWPAAKRSAKICQSLVLVYEAMAIVHDTVL